MRPLTCPGMSVSVSASPTPAGAAGSPVREYNFIGEGHCLTAKRQHLPYYFRNFNPKNDQGAFCSGQCALITGCAGFAYIPSIGWCALSGVAITAGSRLVGTWYFNAGTGGTGAITQVGQKSGVYCYARADATTATTQPGKVAP